MAIAYRFLLRRLRPLPAPPTDTPQATGTSPPSATPGQPDLRITSVTGEQDLEIPSGESEVVGEFFVNVTNIGLGPSGQFETVVRLPDGTRQVLGVSSNLDPGSSISLPKSRDYF